MHHSEKLECHLRPELTFIVDQNNQAFQLMKNRTMQKTKKLLESYIDRHLLQEIKDMIGNNINLILTEKHHTRPT